MAFSESTKLSVQRAAHFHCCLCRTLGVEIHHIVPQAEGGSDEVENAAPLCPSCHETYGANPTKRKFIREARDFWFEICATRYAGDSSWIEEMRARLASLATREDLKELINRNSSSAAGSAESPVPWDSLKYSFERDDFVHPLIVKELIGWLSDPASTVVAVDIGLANRSNRFFGKYSVSVLEDGAKVVQWRGDDQVLEDLRAAHQREWFNYSLVAVSPSGVHMVDCRDCGGGSGVFSRVGLFTFERDDCLRPSAAGALSVENRILLKILGVVHLGDRYSGSIIYRDGVLVVGPDVGPFRRGAEAAQTVRIG